MQTASFSSWCLHRLKSIVWFKTLLLILALIRQKAAGFAGLLVRCRVSLLSGLDIFWQNTFKQKCRCSPFRWGKWKVEEDVGEVDVKITFFKPPRKSFACVPMFILSLWASGSLNFMSTMENWNKNHIKKSMLNNLYVMAFT